MTPEISMKINDLLDPIRCIHGYKNCNSLFFNGAGGSPVWEHTGPHTFRVFCRIHSFDNLGRLVSITEVTTNPSLIKGDDPETPGIDEPYYQSGEGTNRITNLNPDDGSVINVTEGCNEATSRPILFAD